MSCGCKSKNYADFQGAEYSPVNNQILYGINKNMKALGVSDGTCNQLNPQIFTDQYKCGLGAAGGNPCSNNKNYNKKYTKNYNKNIEKFKNINEYNGHNFTNIINIIILILIIYLIYLVVSEQKTN